MTNIFSGCSFYVGGLFDDRRFYGKGARKWTAGGARTIVETVLCVIFHFFRNVGFGSLWDLQGPLGSHSVDQKIDEKFDSKTQMQALRVMRPMGSAGPKDI